jgi:hypothetical protein
VLVAQTAIDGGCPAERPAGIQRSGVIAMVGKARTPATASVAGRRPPCGVHSAVPSSGSGVQPSGVRPSGVQCVRCPPVQCPARPVSTVRRPAGCCPPPSVRTRPSRPTAGGGGDQLEAARQPSPQERVEPRWAATSWSGSMHGRAGPDVGDVAEVARRSGGRWRTRARWAAGAAALDRLSNQVGQAGVRSAVANGCAVGSGAGCSARLPQRPCGCRPRRGGRPRWVVVMGPAARVGGPGRAGGRAGGDGRAAPARPRLAAGAPGSLPAAL